MKAAVVCAFAVMFAAAATSDAAFCHTSSYKLPCTTVEAQKTQLCAKCAALVAGGVTPAGSFTESEGCCSIAQKTVDEAGWQAYTECENSAENSGLYDLLKAAPCDEHEEDEDDPHHDEQC